MKKLEECLFEQVLMQTSKAVYAILLVILLCAVALPAWAVPSYTVLVDVNAVAGGGTPEHQGTGVLVNTPGANATVLSNGTLSQATASAAAAPGTLGAYVAASSGSSSYGGASARAVASFTDTLTLFSGTPGYTGPVTLVFSWSLDGFLSGCASCPAQGNVSSNLTAVSTLGGTYLNNQSSVSYAQSFVGGMDNITSILVPPSFVLTTTIGDEISLRASLNVFTGVGGVGSFGIADYYHTARAYVDVLTADVTYITASGVNYARPSPVPEPATIFLLGSGLAGMAVLRKRLGSREG